MHTEGLNIRFTGKGGEYFRIWIVNLLLTVLTLGIYSAWAKVRRMQYFHRNTWLNESNFDYHGTPIAILKGRLIAIGMFAAYNVMINFKPLIGLAILLVIAIVMPFLLVKSFRFRLYNTSYRGLRFGFTGSFKGAYLNFLLLPVASLFTLYLLAPFTHRQIKAYQHNNSRFGQTAFSFDAGAGQFYLIYFLTFLWFLLAGALLGVGAYFIFNHAIVEAAQENNRQMFMYIGIGVYLLFIIAMLLLVPYFTSRIQNLVWNNTRLGMHEFESNLGAMKLFWISISNFLLIIFTLGLFKPFADVRMARYRLQSIRMMPAGDMDTFLAASKQDDGAMGSETAEMFDIDIAL